MIIKWTLVMFFLGSLAQGHNNAFLPGDAFFSTSLTEEEIARFEEGTSKTLSLAYQRLDNSFMACGHLGYASLKITEVDEKFRENFVRAYREIRGREKAMFVKNEIDEKIELVEWNPVVALVYNKGKVVEPLGVKFNENWKEEGHGRYGGFLDDGFSILQDWQRGPKVPALKLEEDLVPNAHLESLDKMEVPRSMDQELLINAADCEIVFVGLLKKNSWVQDECLNLKSLARLSNWRDSDSSARYAYRVNVTSESAIYHEFEGGVWKQFLLGEGGQLSPMPKLSSEGGDGVESEEEKED